MAMNFPDSPSVDDTFTVGDQTWKWTGTTWDTVPLTEYSPSPHAATHELGGSDPLELDPTQVTGLDELNTGTAGYTALSNGTAGLSYQPVSHNYVINGAFDIWQRGTSFTGEVFNADRYQMNWNGTGGTVTVTQESFSPGDLEVASYGQAEYYARINQSSVPSGQTFIYIRQRVEDVRTLADQEVTISFWAKADAATTIQPNINQFTNGTGGDNLFLDTQNITTSWARYSATTTLGSLAGDTIGSGSALEIRLRLEAGVTFDVSIWGVQLEAGSIATPFKRNANSIQGELAACQRYYQRLGGQQNSHYLGAGYVWTTTEARIPLAFRQTMRAAPSITVPTPLADIRFQSDGANYTGSAVGITGASDQDALFRLTTTSSMTVGNAGTLFTQAQTAFIELSAEL